MLCYPSAGVLVGSKGWINAQEKEARKSQDVCTLKCEARVLRVDREADIETAIAYRAWDET